ncbi:hypothetical protein WEB32_23205 [Streptomyces netropsis]|uniref:Uncharacterized protein n=1 Tax=Streptomyces netropsis TaxID=55404 RepID=A0A7W7L9Y9_STRNE|nr:hypothetical protein [Streptomyces netropsis]MBB4885806.1 hypothetical protein [Streptomyces netropsis]GGR37340.1 hypothetical protein GCM10010219_48080 [Streptomyces netropsis]
MRVVRSVKLAAVALAAASGVALASAPANAATTPLQRVRCNPGDTTQLQFRLFMGSSLTDPCYTGSGDVDVNITSAIFGRAGDRSGHVVFADGTKSSFTKGGDIALRGTIVHLHTD